MPTPYADTLITATELKARLNFKQTSAVQRWLLENKIPFFAGKDGELVTTLWAINQALDRQLDDRPEAATLNPESVRFE